MKKLQAIAEGSHGPRIFRVGESEGVIPSVEDVPNAKMGPDPFCHWCCGGLPPANSFQVIFKAEYRLDAVGLLFLGMLVLSTSFFLWENAIRP